MEGTAGGRGGSATRDEPPGLKAAAAKAASDDGPPTPDDAPKLHCMGEPGGMAPCHTPGDDGLRQLTSQGGALGSSTPWRHVEWWARAIGLASLTGDALPLPLRPRGKPKEDDDAKATRGPGPQTAGGRATGDTARRSRLRHRSTMASTVEGDAEGPVGGKAS